MGAQVGELEVTASGLDENAMRCPSQVKLGPLISTPFLIDKLQCFPLWSTEIRLKVLESEEEVSELPKNMFN